MPEPNLAALRRKQGSSQPQLARAINRLANQDGHNTACNGKTVSAWETGDRRPSDLYEYYLARVLGVRRDQLVYPPIRQKARTGTVPFREAEAAGRAEYAGEDGAGEAAVPNGQHEAEPDTTPLGQQASSRTRPREVRTADRRQAIKTMTVVGAGVLAGGRLVADAVEAAVAASRKRSPVDPMTLEELDQDVERFVRSYPTTPHADLFKEVWEDWQLVERLLDGRQNLGDRAHLTLLAGQLSYLLGRLSFNMGQYTAARKQAVLAWQHADDMGHAVLGASVRMLQSSIAFYGGHYGKALHLLESAEPYATSYTRARIAAYAARAHTMLGDQPNAEAALVGMQRHLVDLPAEPGASPFTLSTATLWLAGIHARLGDGMRAEGYARQALAVSDASQAHHLSPEERAHLQLNLAAALVHRQRPEPEEAARLAAVTVAVPEAQRTDTVRKRALELWVLLGRWHAMPPVKEFGDRLRGYKPLALPAPTRLNHE